MSKHASEQPEILRRVTDAVSHHVDEIEKLFNGGAVVTVVIRFPFVADNDVDMVMGNDSLENAATVIARRQKPRGTIKFSRQHS